MIEIVKRAQNGDATALDQIVRNVQDQVHRLALRMMGDVSLAEDATQDILVRIITKLSTFQGESRFETWVYRVAMNHLLTAKKVRGQDPGLTFSAFEDDLLSGLTDDAPSAEHQLLLNELRLKCTVALLLCLDPDHRAAYVLGDVLEMSQSEAIDVLDVSAATYRKRLSRARSKVEGFTARSCGLVSQLAPCRCERRVTTARQLGRVGQAERTYQAAPTFDDAVTMAHRAEASIVTAKLQRATGPLRSGRDIARDVLKIVNPPGHTP